MDEWKVDRDGKRYRIVEGVMEYEPTLIMGGVDVPFSQIKEVYRRNAEAAIRRTKEQRARAAEAEMVECPILEARNHCGQLCRKDCIFYGVCCKVAAHRPIEETMEKIGKKCVITGLRCTDRCKFYNDGCALAGALERLMEG